MIETAIGAFKSASGVSTDHLSFLIRAAICTLFFLWAAWGIYSLYQSSVHHEGEEYHLPLRMLRVLALCSILIMIVFFN